MELNQNEKLQKKIEGNDNAAVAVCEWRQRR